MSMASFLLTHGMVVHLSSIQAWFLISTPLLTHSFAVFVSDLMQHLVLWMMQVVLKMKMLQL